METRTRYEAKPLINIPCIQTENEKIEKNRKAQCLTNDIQQLAFQKLIEACPQSALAKHL